MKKPNWRVVVFSAVVLVVCLVWRSAEAQRPSAPALLVQVANTEANPIPVIGMVGVSGQPLSVHLGNQPFEPWLDTNAFAAWTNYVVPEGYQAVITHISCRANVSTDSKVDFWFRTDASETQHGAESCLLVGGRSQLCLEAGRETVFGAQSLELHLGPGYTLWVWGFTDRPGNDINCYISGYLMKAR